MKLRIACFQMVIVGVLVLMLSFLSVGAQESEWLDYELFLEQLLDLLPEEEAETSDVSEWMERWTYYVQHPLDLNLVSADDLMELGFLSPLIAGRIIEHRNRSGAFLSILELQSIAGLDAAAAQLLAHVLRVKPISTLQAINYQELIEEGAHELLLRHGRGLETPLGYRIKDDSRSRYLGSPDRILLRYKYQYASRFRVILNMEKDPGEKFWSSGSAVGVDHLSGGVAVRNQGIFDQFILGDYVLQFGQGLGIWMGFSPGGNGALLHGIARQGAGLKLHTSADEINFFRGLAGTVQWRKVRWTPFLSYRQRDASVSEDVSGRSIFASLSSSGLHRTPNEVANKGQVDQWTTGLNAEFGSHSWSVGSTIYTSILNAFWQPQELLRNRYAF